MIYMFIVFKIKPRANGYPSLRFSALVPIIIMRNQIGFSRMDSGTIKEKFLKNLNLFIQKKPYVHERSFFNNFWIRSLVYKNSF